MHQSCKKTGTYTIVFYFHMLYYLHYLNSGFKSKYIGKDDLIMFTFTEDCKIGIEQIDDEHKYLFELLDKAYILVTTDYHSDYYQQLKDIIAELDDYAEQHFSHEEAYMTQICDPELILQRSQHGFFREKIREFDFINIDREEASWEAISISQSARLNKIIQRNETLIFRLRNHWNAGKQARNTPNVRLHRNRRRGQP